MVSLKDLNVDEYKKLNKLSIYFIIYIMTN